MVGILLGQLQSIFEFTSQVPSLGVRIAFVEMLLSATKIAVYLYIGGFSYANDDMALDLK